MHPNDDSGDKRVELQEKIGDAISKVLSEFEGSLVVKFICAVDVMQANGERGLWSFTSPDATRWDIYGMLKDIDNFQIAHQAVEILENHREM